MAQWLRVHTVLAEDPNSVSITHTSDSQLSVTPTLGNPEPFPGFPQILHTCTQTPTQTHACTHKLKIF